MWPDQETTVDLIGFQVHADLVRAVVTRPQMLPTTIGIFGDWGGGKTSILRMLEQDLDPEHWPEGSDERRCCETIAVTYFNTWLFEGYDDAKAAILSSILSELAEHKRFGPKVRDKALSLLRSVRWMRVARLALKHAAIPAAAAFATGGLGAIPAALAISLGLPSILPSQTGTKDTSGTEPPDLTGVVEFGKDGTPEMDVRTFREQFTQMLRDGGITTLVVLVDDLDRCTPDRIIENLEAVKLFLSADQSAFVIGADRRIVEHAIRARYAERAADSGDIEETNRLVRDYLEKLVQIPYALPRLSASEIETYMTLLFCQQHQGSEDFKLCLEACNTSRSENRYASFGYAAVREAMKGKPEIPELNAALTLAAAAAPLIADGLKGNPRQVKRFLNALLLRKELARVARLSNIRDSVLIKLMILEYVHPELFSQLFEWQSQQDGLSKQLAALEAVIAGPEGDIDDEEAAKKIDSKWATTAVRRWIAMDPLLKDVDLRDYFWVARDRLESTFAGISMVAPVVRTVIDGLLSGSPPSRNAAMKTAGKLTEDERASLLSLLETRISRQIEEKSGYDSLRYLAEANISGAADSLAKVLLQNPLDKVPRTVGMDFMNLYFAKPELSGVLAPAKERLLKSTAPVGVAAKSAKAPKQE